MRFLLPLFIQCILVTAQEIDTDPSKNPNADKAGRSCRIVFPERPNDSPKIAYLFDGKKSQRVSLPSMNFSEVIGLSRGELTLVLTGQEITDPEMLPPSAPKVRIPENLSDFYLLISADRDNSTFPVKMNLVSLNDGKLKPGQTLWYNLTNHRIIAKLGEEKLSVQPHGKSVSDKPVRQSGYYLAELGYQPNGKGDFQIITEQQWWHDVTCRHVGFIVGTGGRLPRIYYFRDFRSKPEESGDNQ